MAIELDGVNEYIDLGSGSLLDNLWDGGGSASFWVKLNALPGDGISNGLLSKYPSSEASGWRISVADFAGATLYDNTLRLYIIWSGTDGDWRVPESQFTFTAGVWIHVVVTYDADLTSNVPIFYVNGTLRTHNVFGTPTGSRADDNAVSLEIGREQQTDAACATAQFEDVRAFNRILTADEATILAAGYRGPLGGEVGWWTLNDAQVVTHWDGDSLATTDVIPDMSGNGNDGTPTNTPTGRASEAPRFGTMLW